MPMAVGERAGWAGVGTSNKLSKGQAAALDSRAAAWGIVRLFEVSAMAPPRRAVTQHASNNGPLRAHNIADFERPLSGSITTLFLHRAFLALLTVWSVSVCVRL